MTAARHRNALSALAAGARARGLAARVSVAPPPPVASPPPATAGAPPPPALLGWRVLPAAPP